MRKTLALSCFLIISFVIWLIIPYSTNNAEDANKVITLTLTHPHDFEVTLAIPAKYIGPPNDSLSHKLKRGAKPHKLVPLAFTYPDFQPWPENWAERMRAGDRGLNTIILTTSIPTSIASSSKRIKKEAASGSLNDKGVIYGLEAYARKLPENAGEGFAGKEWQVIYTYLGKETPMDDVYIVCPIEGKIGKCRYSVFIDTEAHLIADFALDPSTLPNWKERVVQLREFIQQFHVSTTYAQ